MDDWGGTNFRNGTFDGMGGMLARHEVDFGGTVMFILKDHMSEIDYISLPMRAR